MIPVVDQSGALIKGVFRDKNGALLVSNQKELDKYNITRENILKQQKEFESLKNQVEELNEIVKLLMKKTNA